MPEPLQTDLIADRNVSFVDVRAYLGQDFTGSDFLMQVRAVRDTTGTPLIDLSLGVGIVLLYAGTTTVAAHVAAGRLLGSGEDNIYLIENPATGLPYVASDSLTLTHLKIGIDVTAFDAIPYPDERGDDWQGYYDLIRDIPSTNEDEMLMRGKFVVRAGVTIP